MKKKVLERKLKKQMRMRKKNLVAKTLNEKLIP